MPRLARWVTSSLKAGLYGIALVIAMLLLSGAYLATTLTLPKGEERPPLLIYGAAFPLRVDRDLREGRVIERLGRLGYHVVAHEPRQPGEFRLTPDTLDVFLREQPDLHVSPTLVRLLLDHTRIRDIRLMPQDVPSFPVALEPQLISGLRGESRQVRSWVPIRDMPPRLIETVLAVEDHRFYWHPGIDPIAVGRALWRNLLKGGVVQGGSTITQQLAKNLFYSPKRTFGRKVQEAMAALVLEAKYRKDEILESYLNEIYLGQAGSVGIYGMEAAANSYFSKTLHDLTIDEMALIAGLIKGPNTYSPLRDRDLARQRRDIVLRRLREEGKLSEEEWTQAVNRPLSVHPPQDMVADAPYFVDYIMGRIEELSGQPLPPGARVYTTLDPILQRTAAEVLARGLGRLEQTHAHLTKNGEPLQGAMVVLDPRSGEIVAMVGGRDYRMSQFNRAVQARRQPGSLFKPLVYLAAFESKQTDGGQPITAASLLLDEPVSFESPAGTWSPQNYDKQFRGKVTVRTALEQSLNVPVVRVAQTVGAKRIAQVARGLGIRSPLDENLTLALGGSAVSLLEIAGSYGALAHDGIVMGPTAFRQVIAQEGDPLWQPVTDRRQAVSPQAAYLMTSLLKGVVERGTAARARSLGLIHPAAGKTGTTDGFRDAWFIGYTPELVVGVWVGFDDGRELKLGGSQAALPIWVDFMKDMLPADSPDFPVPSGIVTRSIDPQTGQLATSQCPESVSEVFIEGTEPTLYCEVHGEGFWDRFKRIFGL